jgi:hypothetical protein
MSTDIRSHLSQREKSDQRVRGIEPPCAAWEAAVLPLNYTRVWKEENSESFRE